MSGQDGAGPPNPDVFQSSPSCDATGGVRRPAIGEPLDLTGDDRRLVAMTDEEFCQVAVTFDDRAAADELLAQIVSERLAACAQVEGPITSTYWWQGTVETAEEWRVDFKTRTDLLDALTARVTELHSYDTPQIVAVPIVGGLTDYLTWIRDEATGDRPSGSAAAAG